jgi:hypothetical protein
VYHSEKSHELHEFQAGNVWLGWETPAMSEGFTIGAAMNAPTIFECPNCKETIDSTADVCRFCGVKVDHASAQKAAELLAKINQACSDASYMKTAALTVPVFFLRRFIPFASMLVGVGFIGLMIIIPGWAIRWWTKFGGIASSDSDFVKARTTVKVSGVTVSILLVLLVFVPFLIGFLRAAGR